MINSYMYELKETEKNESHINKGKIKVQMCKHLVITVKVFKEY